MFCQKRSSSKPWSSLDVETETHNLSFHSFEHLLNRIANELNSTQSESSHQDNIKATKLKLSTNEVQTLDSAAVPQWQMATKDNGWQKTFPMVKTRTWYSRCGDSQRYSHAIHKTNSLLVRELFVLFDPLLQRWIWKHQSTAAGPLSFEVVMFHVCWQSRKKVKSSQWRCLETSRWFRFEAKVSSFLSPEADQTRNQGFT